MSNGKNSEILFGALLGGALAGGIALFLNSKKGLELRTNMSETCHAIGDKFEDVVDAASETAEKLKGEFIDTFVDDHHSSGKKKGKHLVNKIENTQFLDAKIGLLVGAILGGIFSAAFATWGSSDKEPVISSFNRKVSPYIHDLKQVINNLTEFSEEIDSPKEPRKEPRNGLIQEAVDFTLAGAKLWNEIQSRR